MKKLTLLFLIPLFLMYCKDMTDSNIESDSTATNNKPGKEENALPSNTDVWVGAYFASWNHLTAADGNRGTLSAEEIDWDAFTHLNYFALRARSDGSLSPIASNQNMNPDRINAAVSAAHNAGKPILFTIGGWGNYDGFSGAISSGSRSAFIANITATIEQWGFDGVDLDMEPIRSGDFDNYIAFVNGLHAALQEMETPMLADPLITVATSGHGDLFANIHDKIDQINLMTYDLSGAWQGWVSWHNASIYDGGLTFPGLSRFLPSAHGEVQSLLNAGVPASKIGIGIDFYGYVWSGGSGTSTGGVTRPNQSWISAPSVTDNVPYHEIMDQYYSEDRRHWDSDAQAVYLSIDQSGSSNDKFISYDDEQTIRAKFDYIREKGLGGTIIWELSGGYRQNNPAGERDNLLQAVKQALNEGPGSPPLASDLTDPDISLGSPADGSTVSGTVEINIQASDNTGVSNVGLSIGGETVQNFSSAPYTYSWNTAGYPNQAIELECTATDAAGNTNSQTVSVVISNSNPAPPPSSSPKMMVYEDQLASPWVNASWNSSVDFNSTEKAYSGESSMKVEQSTWGGLSLHNGSWGDARDLDPTEFEAVEFAVYAKDDNASIAVLLENNRGASFPKVSYGTAQANQWMMVRVPMDQLNPGNLVFHRLDILEMSGSARTYFVDDLKLIKSGGGAPHDINTPVPVSPQNGDRDISSGPTLNWNGDTPFYRLQVAQDPNFQNRILDEQVTSSSHSLSNLSPGATYYWRVQGSDLNRNTSTWSSTWSFTVQALPAGSFLEVYSERLNNPWINASWNASVDYRNTERVRNGNSAVKVVQYRWGGLSIHNGNWGDTQDIQPTQYKAVEFAVYAATPGTFGVMLENDRGDRFPRVTYGSVSPNEWTVIRIPMNELNPDNRVIHRLDILEASGSTKTYYVDDIRLIE